MNSRVPSSFMENIETLLAAVSQTQGFEDNETVSSSVKTVTFEDSASLMNRKMDDFQMGGVMLEVSGDSIVDRPSAVVNPPLLNPSTGQLIGSGDRRKRGRPPRGQLEAKPPPTKRKKLDQEEEDVCFICFDGGSLVLCDRKGCPKAYHPACIKRDEAFFRSKAKWNCGWHICSVCRKASHYLCYTCTYSLCKGCTKNSDYVCVRGNKGFCTTCMRTIMLIENKDRGNNEMVQVDFDDKSSWEYLFKVYWIFLKEKLSLTNSEVTQAKKPWKGAGTVACKLQSTQVHSTHNGEVSVSYGADNGEFSVSYHSSGHLELNKTKEQHISPNKDQLSTKMSSIEKDVDKSSSDKGADEPNHNNDTVEPSINKGSDNPVIVEGTDKPCMDKDTDKPSSEIDLDKSNIEKEICEPDTDKGPKWASKDLLEFVAHMKNGDTTVLSQFDVQSLLLDYIKRNKLRDPRRKSQIICDLRLKNLFGKPRVGHIEMLKLLEFHFLIKDDSQKNAFIPAGFVGPVTYDVEVDGNRCDLLMTNKSRRRKSQKKDQEKLVQTNFDEFAAVDIHNIKLIYLRRNLMENLIEDKEKFHDKVVGSIVRIRISSNDQKPDMYRLVQVVGTKGAESYKTGDRTTDIMLEVLNLDKKEAITIDAISNQEFSEDECRRLRQSIRCGLAKRFTVGELQKKAMALKAIRLNDLLEAEILRLNHLRDRASEKGHKKELRECVMKLQLLKSPEERQRRICEIPEIHADPKMNPNYETEEDAGGGDSKDDEYLRPIFSGFNQNRRQPIAPNKKGKEHGPMQTHNRMKGRTFASGSNWSEKHASQVNIPISATGGRSGQTFRWSGSETSTATVSMENSPYASHIETEKLWHYRDPNGKIQGPFSMVQLRKWSATGFFPPDMRIWTNNEQYDSLLLTDALNGPPHASSELPYSSTQSQELGATLDDKLLKCDAEGSEEMNGTGTGRDNKPTEAAQQCSSLKVLTDINTEFEKADGTGSSLWHQCLDLLNDNETSIDKVQESSVLSSSSLGQTEVARLDRCHENDGFNYGPQSGDKNSTGPTKDKMSCGHDCENQSNKQNQLGQSSKENVASLPIILNSRNMDYSSGFAHVAILPGSSRQEGYVDLSDLPSPTPMTNDKAWEVQISEKQQPGPSYVLVQNSDNVELPSSTSKSNNEVQVEQVSVTKSALMSSPAPSTGPSWGSASSVVVTAAQLPEIADEWCGYSPTPVKQFFEELDAAFASPSSLKPPEATHGHAHTATSDGNQGIHCPSHYASGLPNWQLSYNEPIEFDALGEESVSDLLAEVDAMESQGVLSSPTSAMKFSKELIQDFKDDCFSSIEDFNSTLDPGKSDAFSSTDIHVACQSAMGCKPYGASHAVVQSSASSEGETNTPVYRGEAGSEFHPPVQNMTNMGGTTMALGMGSDAMDSGRVTVQGNINLVTVQGNVNLVLSGPAQGITDLGWGTNPGTGWGSPKMNCSALNGSLPWDGQRKYTGERFFGPRDWAYQSGEPGFGRGRPLWTRMQYGGGSGGGGYSRPLPKGQRVCKFYESGHCKKGAFCDYLHP